ncbi:MAG: hypothetical protein LQ343_001063 [Gyalolechia ehrenbergii]|nr:MAG: hypothetical protein LQ343_001063 [Gyalolechia ehrenbergii]
MITSCALPMNTVLILGDQDTGGTANASYGGQTRTGIGQFSTNQAPAPCTRINPSISKASVTPLDFRHATKSTFSKLVADRKNYFQQPGSSGYDDVYFPDDVEKDESVSFHTLKSEQTSLPKMDQRTIIFKNLSDRTTHQDIVNVVRGGLLLDIYIRASDKSANVSFVHGTAAQEFMAYLKRNDVYIHGRRVAFAWGDRQYILPGHLANKIGIGATRNLIIRRIYPNVTEKGLREDLDHIHNLVIVNVSFASGDAYLSLNSIRSSLFARTCMMSRATYKGLQIEWYPDECALSLPKLPNAITKEKARPPKSNGTSMINRFQLLNMDEDVTENGSSFAEEDEPTMTSGFSPLQTSRRSPWNVPAAVA